MNIVVLGYLVRGPLGGMAWHHLQYVIGLKELGHAVLFVEDSDDYPTCYDPSIYQVTTDPTYGLKFCGNLFSRYELEDCWSYYDAHTHNWFGQSKEMVLNFCKSADVVLNLSGINPVRQWWADIPVRVLVDTDPVFTQIRYLKEPEARNVALAHTHFFTFGENFGKPACSVPDDGFLWKPTRQPVCLHLWDGSYNGETGSWSSVMQWDSYKTQEWEGRFFGMKSGSFNEYLDLPSRMPSETFELALGSHGAPKDKLEEAGWFISNPLEITLTTDSYQHFIRQSRGEWSVAKHGYVVTNSGWFSERSTSYLASGKPVVVQDTGFSSFLPTGSGLLCFSSIDEAIESIKKVKADYKSHCEGARNIVEEYFRSDLVLTDLLKNL